MVYDDLVAKWAIVDEHAANSVHGIPQREQEKQMMAGQEQTGWAEPQQQQGS